MRFTKLAAAVAGIALGSTLVLAADKPADKKEKTVKPAATMSKPTDKAGQGGIILQNQGGKVADKSARGGIILQNQGAAQAPAATGKTTTQKTTGGTQ